MYETMTMSPVRSCIVVMMHVVKGRQCSASTVQHASRDESVLCGVCVWQHGCEPVLSNHDIVFALVLWHDIMLYLICRDLEQVTSSLCLRPLSWTRPLGATSPS
jgi:hypothetical protein